MQFLLLLVSSIVASIIPTIISKQLANYFYNPDTSPTIPGRTAYFVGDTNGDHWEDILVTDPNLGISAIVLGGPNVFDTKAFLEFDISLLSPPQGYLIHVYQFSTGLTSGPANDFNGDGLSDYFLSDLKRKEVFVVYGKRDLNNIDLEEFTAADGLKIEVTSRHEEFGSSVVGLGDINGDHISDMLLISEYFDNSLVFQPSRFFVLFGSKNHPATLTFNNSIDPNQGFLIEGTQSYQRFYTAADLTDLNGDGFDDFAISDFKSRIIWIIFGKENGFENFSLENPPSTTITIKQTSSSLYMGRFLSPVGDINGDGFVDLLISGSNRAYFVLGDGIWSDSFTLEEEHGYSVFYIYPDQAFYGFGSVAKYGDFNQDGLSDSLILSHSSGSVYLLFGQENMTDLAMETLGSQGIIIGRHYKNFMDIISSDVDFDHDGLNDLLISNFDTNQQNQIDYLSGKSIKNHFHTEYSIQSGSEIDFGINLIGLFDINGDNIDDILIQNFPDVPYPYKNHTEIIAFLLFGNHKEFSKYLPFPIENHVLIYADRAPSFINSSYQYVFASAGDINNDHFFDIIIGTTFTREGYGDIYLIFGDRSLPSELYLSNLESYGMIFKKNENEKNHFYRESRFFISIGDFNGDSISDLLLDFQIKKDNEDENEFVNLIVLYGNSDRNQLENTDLLSISSSQGRNSVISSASLSSSSSSSSSYLLSAGGDINHDGLNDFLIAINSEQQSEVKVFFGCSNDVNEIPVMSLLKLINNNNHNRSNSLEIAAISSAGDVNRDSFDDIVMTLWNENMQGKVMIFFGQSILYQSFHSIVIESTSLQLGFGSFLSSFDLNRDGFHDVMILTNQHLFIVFGKDSLQSIPDIENDESISISIRSVDEIHQLGDFDADGFPDFSFEHYFFSGRHLLEMTPTGAPTFMPTAEPTMIPSTEPTAEPSRSHGNRQKNSPSSSSSSFLFGFFAVIVVIAVVFLSLFFLWKINPQIFPSWLPPQTFPSSSSSSSSHSFAGQHRPRAVEMQALPWTAKERDHRPNQSRKEAEEEEEAGFEDEEVVFDEEFEAWLDNDEEQSRPLLNE